MSGVMVMVSLGFMHTMSVRASPRIPMPRLMRLMGPAVPMAMVLRVVMMMMGMMMVVVLSVLMWRGVVVVVVASGVLVIVGVRAIERVGIGRSLMLVLQDELGGRGGDDGSHLVSQWKGPALYVLTEISG
ncbi:hypothetical protein ACOMHN_050927 [Nucella lapillus]